MDDCAGLENRYTSGYRGFESHSLRHTSFSTVSIVASFPLLCYEKASQLTSVTVLSRLGNSGTIAHMLVYGVVYVMGVPDAFG